MQLRVCLVTPFAWSQPHEVNEHVDAVAGELRGLGHQVTVLAPRPRASTSARAAARSSAALPDVIALGPALPISRR